ncbi:hypothetical protein [Streptomyces yanii]|uniref:GNAT family N-acetyltransferase n=1 Tax=Streptomyces yanii TaxID=78510 RepID=A0ABV5R9B7_9ACTN
MIKPQIRPARPSDIDAVAQLLARKWDITASTVTRWLDEGPRGDDFLVLIACQEDRLCAVGVAEDHRERRSVRITVGDRYADVELAYLIVDRAVEGRKVGRDLQDRLLRDLENDGHTLAALRVEKKEIQADGGSVGFWEKCEWTNRGDEPGTDKTILMSIDLPRPTASVAIA